MATRYFTLDEAQALLPQVRGFLGRALQLHAHLRRTVAELGDEGHEISWSMLRGDEAPDDLPRAAEHELARARMLYATLRESVTAVEDLGAEVKGVIEGLVDFRSWRDGCEEVCLCWKLGEAEIGHYHGIHDGFAERRPIAGQRFTGTCEHSERPERSELPVEPAVEPAVKLGSADQRQ